jgi:hypothetical protein
MTSLASSFYLRKMKGSAKDKFRSKLRGGRREKRAAHTYGKQLNGFDGHTRSESDNVVMCATFLVHLADVHAYHCAALFAFIM